MNEYRITFTSETGESSNLNITERTEAAARKSFNTIHKGMGFTIQSMELIRADAIATKQQERDTLAAIRRMVEELGPQSYLATAFAGCFEDAESNIENDFADSMKARYLHADAELNAAKGTIEELEEKLRQEIAERQRARDEAREVIKKLEAKVLSNDDLEDIRQLLSDRAAEADETAKKYAAEIVERADDPAGREFQEAVRMHRNYTREAEYTRNLLGRVVAAQVATRTQG
jgi:hypothetical protein